MDRRYWRNDGLLSQPWTRKITTQNALDSDPLPTNPRAPSLGALAQASGAAITVGIEVLLGARTASDRNVGVRKKRIGVAPPGSGEQAS